MTEDDIATEPDSARHNEKMKKKKAARDKILATKTIEKGLLIVHTGKGKGKSTAAFGMVFRADRARHAGRRRPVRQGRLGDGRARRAREIPRSRDHQGDGRRLYLGNAGPRSATSPQARAAWEDGQAMIADPAYKMVLLDELNIVLRYDYLPLDEVIEVLRNQPRDKHVIVTGRNASDELIEIADLVTEMEQIKHPFRAGVKAQAGIEF